MAPKNSTPHLSTLSRTVLPGSEKAPLLKAAGEKPAPHNNRLDVTVIVRRKKPLKNNHLLGQERLTHAQFRANHAADPAAVKLVRAFAKEFGLTVQPGTPAPGRRAMKLSGTVAAMQKAFGTTLSRKTIDGVTYRVREGSIDLPTALVGAVEAVLGLDNRPQAQPHFRIAGEQGAATARAAQGNGFASPTPTAMSPTPPSRSPSSTSSPPASPRPTRPSASSSSAAATAPPTSTLTSKPSARSPRR